MRLFERLAVAVPRKVTLAVMSIAGLWGMRTPPEPEVVAQMAPARGMEGEAPPTPPDFAPQLYVRAPRTVDPASTESSKKLE